MWHSAHPGRPLCLGATAATSHGRKGAAKTGQTERALARFSFTFPFCFSVSGATGRKHEREQGAQEGRKDEILQARGWAGDNRAVRKMLQGRRRRRR